MSWFSDAISSIGKLTSNPTEYVSKDTGAIADVLKGVVGTKKAVVDVVTGETTKREQDYQKRVLDEEKKKQQKFLEDMLAQQEQSRKELLDLENQAKKEEAQAQADEATKAQEQETLSQTKKRQREVASRFQGRRSTILTGPMGLGSEGLSEQPRKTLLGA